MKKVYAVIATQISECEVLAPIIKVFETKESAIVYFNDFVYGEDGEYHYACDRGWQIDANYKEYYFEAYESGKYYENSTSVELREIEVTH